MRGALLAVAALVGTTLISATGSAAEIQASVAAPTIATDEVAASPTDDRIGLDAGRYEVTLITGDTVTLSVTDRGQYEATVEDPSAFTSEAGPDGIYMFPNAALRAIQAGRLDKELFNIGYLVQHGYGDRSSGQLPVIVQYPAARRSQSVTEAAAALPASSVQHRLPSIRGASLTVPKQRADVFWRSASGQAPESETAKATLSSGITRIWLDARVHATLDESVPLIGAPEAWAAGYDGSGVRVAVLDTGIDASHPDLAGKVVASKSFVPGVDTVVDGNGHGTHVASTIAGSGAASDGQYTGVAPGAELAIGKVLNDSGSGTASQIIDAMEWAATEADADVVSMSLGAGPTKGTDPLSLAVNELTASTGALFVIAAGNDGPGEKTVSTPGTADAALTVAATDKHDGLAGFSSRGPRAGDLALKPDIAAPGVHIGAARAAGTSLCQDACVQPGDGPIDEFYTAASGTSMATPHVAGAAAILKQAHPDWDADQLKSALMSTSKDDGFTVYEQGAGRVDVARSVSQQVFATTPSVDYGIVGTSDDDPADPLDRQVDYTNLSDEPVALELDGSLTTLDGTSASDGALAVDGSVQVPAGGSATATVTLDPTALETGTYSGAVIATDPVTGARLRTPVGLTVEPPKVTLTIHTLDRDGQPIGDRPIEQGGDLGGYAPFPSSISAYDVPGVAGLGDDIQPVGRGVERVRVQPGTYSIYRDVRWWDDQAEGYVAGGLFDAQVEVTGDTDVTLDARAAKPVTFDVPQAVEGESWTGLRIERSMWDGQLLTSYDTVNYLTPTERVTAGTFRVAFAKELHNPQLTVEVRRPHRMELHPPAGYVLADQGVTFGQAQDGSVERAGGWVPFPAGTHTLEVVDAGFGDPEDIDGLDLDGKLALLQWGDDRNKGDGGLPESAIWIDRIANVRRAGAVGVILFPNPPAGSEHNSAFSSPAGPGWFEQWPAAGEQEIGIPDIELKRSEGSRLLAMLAHRHVTVTVRSDPNTRYAYHLHPTEEQQVPDDLHYSFSRRDLARVDSAVHSAGPLQRARHPVASLQPGTFFTMSWAFKFAVPKPRVTEYFGPLASDVVFTRSTYTGEWTMNANPRVFDRSTHTEERVNAVPRVPGAVSVENYDPVAYPPPEGVPASKFVYCAMCRQGGTFLPYEQVVAGIGQYAGSGLPSDIRLFTAAGEEMPRAVKDGLPVFEMPPGTDRYRLVQDDQGVETTWRYTSTTPDQDTVEDNVICFGDVAGWSGACRSEPLVYLAYDLGDDLRIDNTVAPRDGLHRFEVTAYRGQTTEQLPRIDGLRLWTSLDDGQTWRPARAMPAGPGSADGRTFRVLARYPRHAQGTVSLKAIAWDADGNRVEQVVHDAFALSRRR